MITYAKIQKAIKYHSDAFPTNRDVCDDLKVDYKDLLANREFATDPCTGPFMDGLVVGLRLAKEEA